MPTHTIIAGWLIDGTGNPVRENMCIRMDHNTIHSVRPAVPEDLHHPNCLDLSRATIFPGLIDAHLHLFMSATGDAAIRQHQLNAAYEEMIPVIADHLRLLRNHGIVAIRDGGDYGGYALRYRDQFLRDLPVRIHVAGKAWRKADRYGKLIGRPPEEGLSLAEAIAEMPEKIDHVKIVNSGLNSLRTFGKETPSQFSPGELTAAVRAAHARGWKVMVHCNGKEPVRMAIEAGADSVEHGFFMGTDNLKRMADHGTVWVPTAITMKAYAEQLTSGSMEADIAHRTFQHQLDQIAQARTFGVTIALGTDAGSLGVWHGKAVQSEMTILMDAGFSLEEAVQCATRNGAALLGLKDYGQIAPGFSNRMAMIKGSPETFRSERTAAVPCCDVPHGNQYGVKE